MVAVQIYIFKRQNYASNFLFVYFNDLSGQ